MAIRNGDPCYDIACKLGDVEHTIATQFSLCNGTIGKDMVDSLVGAKAILQDINDKLNDALPHLQEILLQNYSDEQRHFEEAKEETGEKPDDHIFYSFEALSDFVAWVEDMSDV